MEEGCKKPSFSTTNANLIEIKYKQLLKNIKSEYLGKFLMKNVVKRKDLIIYKNTIAWNNDRTLLVDFYKMYDKNSCEPLRLIDKSIGAKIEFNSNIQLSYVAVINKYNKKSLYSSTLEPSFEYFGRERNKFSGIIDPREEVLSRNYDDPIASIAQNKKDKAECKLKNEFALFSQDLNILEIGSLEANQELIAGGLQHFLPDILRGWKDRTTGICEHEMVFSTK